MPNSIVKSFAKKTGKPEKEIEKMWNTAVEITEDTFNIKEKDFKEKMWKYCTGILKNMLEINESFILDFLTSDKSAKDFIDETMISAPLVQVIPTLKPKKKDDKVKVSTNK